MSPQHVKIDKTERIWRVTLNRPEKANALSRGMLAELVSAFRQAEADEDLRVLTITGAGERAFSGGADLSDLGRYQAGKDDGVWDELATTLMTLPVLTLALINGACIGGGHTLALGCDVRLGVPEAKFGYPVLRNGVFLGELEMAKMQRLIGPGRTSLLLLGGATVTAQEALNWGLIDRLVPRDRLGAEADALAATAIEADKTHLARLKATCRGAAS